MSKFQWETISLPSQSFGWTERAKTYGGWLIRTIAVGDAYPDNNGALINCVSPTVCVCFVPDPRHRWVIKETQHEEYESGWINIYYGIESNDADLSTIETTGECIYDTKELADLCARNERIDCIKIYWKKPKCQE